MQENRGRERVGENGRDACLRQLFFLGREGALRRPLLRQKSDPFATPASFLQGEPIPAQGGNNGVFLRSQYSGQNNETASSQTSSPARQRGDQDLAEKIR